MTAGICVDGPRAGDVVDVPESWLDFSRTWRAPVPQRNLVASFITEHVPQLASTLELAVYHEVELAVFGRRYRTWHVTPPAMAGQVGPTVLALIDLNPNDARKCEVRA